MIKGTFDRRKTGCAIIAAVLALVTACAQPGSSDAGSPGAAPWSEAGAAGAPEVVPGPGDGERPPDKGPDVVIPDDGAEPKPVTVGEVRAAPRFYAGLCPSAPAVVKFSAVITGPGGTGVVYRWVANDGSHSAWTKTTLPAAAGGAMTSKVVTSTSTRPGGGWPAHYRGSRSVEIQGSPVIRSAAAGFGVECKPLTTPKISIQRVTLTKLAGQCQMDVVVTSQGSTAVDEKTFKAGGSYKLVSGTNDQFGLAFGGGWRPVNSDSWTYRAYLSPPNGYPFTYRVTISRGGAVVASRSSNGGTFCGR